MANGEEEGKTAASKFYLPIIFGFGRFRLFMISTNESISFVRRGLYFFSSPTVVSNCPLFMTERIQNKLFFDVTGFFLLKEKWKSRVWDWFGEMFEFLDFRIISNIDINGLANRFPAGHLISDLLTDKMKMRLSFSCLFQCAWMLI